ncbi:MAG TPA: DUF1847 domain-containing protein [Syntrophorhabdaceae bacterium]|nr:DUF1847 domain-containing protein [Syntrophorhabdaceae bacterium]
MKKKIESNCAHCAGTPGERLCVNPDGKSSKGCPTVLKKDLAAKARREYRKKDVHEFARKASIQEGECYADRDKRPYRLHPVKPRILEICEFAKKMKYKKLGLAFCGGLAKEAEMISQFFILKGFEVVSVMCKAGSMPKEELGLKDSQKIHRGQYEAICNPILQALVVNEAKTQFNVLVGLCVGHDSLFLRYAEAPSTVLAVKDRVTGHNPLAALYTLGSYYAWLEE